MGFEHWLNIKEIVKGVTNTVEWGPRELKGSVFAPESVKTGGVRRTRLQSKGLEYLLQLFYLWDCYLVC